MYGVPQAPSCRATPTTYGRNYSFNNVCGIEDTMIDVLNMQLLLIMNKSNMSHKIFNGITTWSWTNDSSKIFTNKLMKRMMPKLLSKISNYQIDKNDDARALFCNKNMTKLMKTMMPWLLLSSDYKF